jgi:hypothetical protein
VPVPLDEEVDELLTDLLGSHARATIPVKKSRIIPEF